MTQAQAHHALIGFIHRAVAHDARVVLVITGKGGASSGQDPFREQRQGERGVLRRAAPLWLSEPSLRGFVLSVEEASRPHGGGGALYVRLRRNRQG
jgi:DNA-nicking Smr family endonuclease